MKSDDQKKAYALNKKRIQSLFWEKMSLRVDIPKSGGSGNTNSGNTARKAFSDPELFSEITNIDVRSIERLQTILIAISCKLPLNIELFKEYCHETGRLYMQLFPDKPMTATLHKILVHGSQIMQNSNLPLGFFGEDAPESRNKLYRNDREHHLRKDMRTHNLADVFNRAMESSDPLLSSFGLGERMKKRRHKPFPKALHALLQEPQIDLTVSETEAASDSETLLEDLDLELRDDIELDAEEVE
nr:PREDICTED: uncharacterized protein LOC109034777 isoform X2 [Bemisia tabaci]